jgi:hypothetical protein
VQADYDRTMGEVLNLSSWLVRMVYSTHAVGLRDTGGIYFVPRDGVDEWKKLVGAIRAASAHQFFEVPALRSSEAVDAILDALITEAGESILKMEEQLTSDKLGEKALHGRVEKCDAMKSKIESYEALLGTNLDKLRERLDGLKANLAAAALLKGED